jgi:zeaxanthin glucosyltransferase
MSIPDSASQDGRRARRNIALIAPPYAGHTNPMLAIAAALVARGYRASFLHTGPAPAAPPGVSTVRLEPGTSRGVTFAALPPVRLTARRTAGLLDVLPGTLREIGADAVVADQLEPAGALAAALLGLPWVSVACALPVNREPGVPPPFTAWRYRADPAGLRRNRAGWLVHDVLMRPLSQVIARWARDRGLPQRCLEDTFSPLAQISQMVPGLDFPRRDLPATFHYVGPIRAAHEAPEMLWGEDRLARGERLVFASLGTLQGHRADLFGEIAAAAESLGVDLLIAHGGLLSAGAAAALPGQPEVRDFVAQRAVLAHAAALVGHGGMNTVMDAIAAGVPAVLVPLAFEQAAIAARLERAGAGVAVRGRLFRGGRIRAALRAVLDEPGFREAAAALRREAGAAGGAARAADIIGGVAATPRGAPLRIGAATPYTPTLTPAIGQEATLPRP